MSIKAFAHYKAFYCDFTKKLLHKSFPIYKTVEEIVAVVKNVVVRMDDKDFF